MGHLKVAIDAQIIPGVAGGAAQATMALIHGLGKLNDGSETYTIIVGSKEQLNWLKPFVGPNQQFVMKRGQVKRGLGPLLPAARYARNFIRRRLQQWPEVPVSDGFYERLGCEVVYFTTQHFVLCALPSIYKPHDLQHLHYPQFSTPSVIAWRETIYPAGCHFAHTVVVGSQSVKNDIIRWYRVIPDKVQVIPESPPTQVYAEPSQERLTEVKNRYQLQQPFAVYPAVTWPHKNHLRLFEAVAYLRDTHGQTIRLVCTGSPFRDFWPRIKRCVEELKLGQQVKFLGFVPEEDMRAIYRLSQFLVMPTLFEASSLPIFEAWLEGIPVACSNIASLQDQVLDAALMFDPNDVESIANAVATMATDMELQEVLRKRGYQRLKDFNWERTARSYRAVCRRAGGYPLTEEDRWLLDWDWMRDPQRTMESR